MRSTKKKSTGRPLKDKARMFSIIAIRIPQDVHRALKEEAESEACTMTELARSYLVAQVRGRKRA